ncbi:uncharacterized protein TNCV_2569871 [Trichonephila clavipes]|nr:uncharacterized protein TNCV_2569871 [Trichonephila clavipes]
MDDFLVSKGKPQPLLSDEEWQCKVFITETTAEFSMSFVCEIIEDFLLQFQPQFSDLDSKAEEMGSFLNSFEADMASCPDDLLQEVIEFQANEFLRAVFLKL